MSIMFPYKNLNAKDRIIKTIAFLNRTHPFYAVIALRLNRQDVQDKTNIPTMAINQYGHLFYNEDFVHTLTFEELQAVVAHECSHVAFLTFPRRKSRDMTLWNIATDIAINWILKSDGLTLPTDCLIPDDNGIMDLKLANLKIDVKDLPAEKIYELLEKESEKIKLNYNSMDQHLEGDSNGQGGNTGEESSEGGNSTGTKEENEHRWKQVCVDAYAVAKNRGKIGSGIERLLDSILRPKLNWKELLNRFITKELPYDYTYSRPSKKSYSSGFYMPRVLKENLNIVITCDVSGSISRDDYIEFITEVTGIINSHEQVRARMLFWSTYIAPEDDIEITRENSRDLTTYTAHSGGGTSLNCVAEYVEQKGIQCRVYIHLTDGYVEDNPKLPEGTNIVVISTNGSEEAFKNTSAIVCSLTDNGN